MDINSLYEELSYGELSNLSMSGEGSGSIVEEKRPSVIVAANDGLVKLYTRFVLKKKDLVLQQYAHITNYHLIPRFAESQRGEEDYAYILDLAGEPFTGDVCKVLEVWSSFGSELPLNDNTLDNSVFTPQANVLQVPNPVAGAALGVVYQAFHPKLKLDDPEQEIELPLSLESAFKSYIAYKIYTNIGTQDATAKAQEHLGNYEAQCQLATEKDLVNTSVSETNTRFEKRGWK